MLSTWAARSECVYFAIYETVVSRGLLESASLYKLLSFDNFNSTPLLITVKQLNSMLIHVFTLSYLASIPIAR